MEDFPGNSNIKKIVTTKPVESETPEPKKLEQPVIDGKVVRRPKSLGARFKDVFLAESTGFGDYIVKEVIIPGARDLFFGAIEQTLNGIKQGVERQIFGEVRSTSKTSYGTGRPIKINYNGMSSASRSSSTRPPIGGSRYGSQRVQRRSNTVDNIILESREACQDVLMHLDQLIDRQGHCTVGDYYSTVNVRPTSTDEQWGWVDVSNARINKIAHDEYLISMPRPEPIESEEI